MLTKLFCFLSVLSLSRCAPKLDGKDHFHVAYEDELGIENLYILPYKESADDGGGGGYGGGIRGGGDQMLDALESDIIEEENRKLKADDRPLKLIESYAAEGLEVAERKLNIHRRTFYCNVVWSPMNSSRKTFTKRYQIQYHAIHQILLHDARCEDLTVTARQHCLHFAKEAFHGSVSPMSETASQNACHYFRATATPRERRRIYLAYKVDNCDRRYYKRLGDVCCWRCVGKKRRTLLNPRCESTPPSDCDVIDERGLEDAEPEHLLVF